MRSGRLQAHAALELARLLDISLPSEPVEVRWRLMACRGGCDPAGFTLYWEDAEGNASCQRIWLTTEMCRQVLDALEKLADEAAPPRRTRRTKGEQSSTND